MKQLLLWPDPPRPKKYPDDDVGWRPNPFPASPRHAKAINYVYQREVYKWGECPACKKPCGPKSIHLCDRCRLALVNQGRRGKLDGRET